MIPSNRIPIFFLRSTTMAICATVIFSCKSIQFNEELDGGNSLQAISQLEDVPLLDVNDVSILFPKRAFIKLSDKFMTDAQFKEVIAAGEGQGPTDSSKISFGAEASKKANIDIVGLRYDPCAPGAHAAAQIAEQVRAPNTDAICQNQLRLIAQPVVGGSDQDVTFHLLYDLPKTEDAKRAQLRALTKIKNAAKAAGASTDGVPLTEHPGLATGNAAVTTALNELLALTTNPNKLVSVAVMALAGGGPEPWVFYATRNIGGKMTITQIPTVEGNSRFQALSFIGSERVLGKPSSTATFSFPGLPALARDPILSRSTHSIFANPKFDDTNILPLAGEMDKIHAIDNPKVNHFFTMDCVSCHTSGNLMMRRHISTTNANEKATIAGPNGNRCDVPKGITGYIAARTLPTQETFQRPWSVRNFGFFNGSPTVTFRTACETVEVVNDINRVILARTSAGPNPAKDLSEADYRKIEPNIWKCMHFGAEQSFFNCFATAKNSLGAGGPKPQENACAKTPPQTVLQALGTVGTKLILTHGPSENEAEKFTADLVVIDPKDGFPAAQVTPALSANPTIKLSIVHRNTNPGSKDTSNMALVAPNAASEKLEGFRYNMKPTLPNQFRVSLNWKCDAWEGSVGPDPKAKLKIVN